MFHVISYLLLPKEKVDLSLPAHFFSSKTESRCARGEGSSIRKFFIVWTEASGDLDLDLNDPSGESILKPGLFVLDRSLP
mmetsp:Transcript_9238/g.13881  ORF Transcript_9238/g.13881 Transcript_9238/m.13881 type:complete len:80 (+) Transcript_9238:1830-2069(+)